MRELIHFAHGNGFPALCYKQMLDELARDFDYCFVDRLGHDPRFPVGENWHNLVLEVINSIREQSNQPVIAVGHSLGGVLSLLASIEEPSLFKCIIMLDSPLLGHIKSKLVKVSKVLGFIDKVTPANRTKGRRTHWQDHEELVKYLKSRQLFHSFTDECLEDYINYGLEKRSDGYHLRFDSHIEYQIYRTVPHVIPKYAGKLVKPAALIYGDQSNVVDALDIRYMLKQFNIKSYQIKGTHLFPMEHPKAAAEKVKTIISAII
jgi:pimeloyl-ACP methyl ester carboxylesterase